LADLKTNLQLSNPAPTAAQFHITAPRFPENDWTERATLSFARAKQSHDARTAFDVLSHGALDHLQGGPVGDSAALACPLTTRQCEALQHCAAGKSDWDIGVLMNVATATAHCHIESAKRRLGVKTRVQAVLMAYKNGWISA